MTRTRSLLVPALAIFSVVCILAILVLIHSRTPAAPASPGPTPATATSATPIIADEEATGDDSAPTTVYAHNLLLRKGSVFRIYVRWIRGEMLRAKRQGNPSFDDPDSFTFHIDKGLIHANLGDIGNFLNTAAPAGFPLTNITVVGDGDQVRLTGTAHKLFLSLPVEIISTVSATADGRIHLRVAKINVLKIPMKALLGGLHLQVDDLMGKSPVPGLEVSSNDLFFDTEKLLPPPHIRGHLTSVRVARPDLVLTYGDAPADETALARWHNFLRLNGGTLDFGKLTMHHADLTLIDASTNAWFDLDLVNYQAQLVNGYTRMTPQAGLEIFMPEFDSKAPPRKTAPPITLEWLQNRNRSLPSDIPLK